VRYTTFGNTGIEVSRLGFGAMRLPMVSIGSEEFVDIDRAVDTIRHAFELGVNYIDSGFIYCAKESEIAVGRALRGWRDKVTVTTKATKMRMDNPGDLRRMLDHQLAKLDLDYVDFYCFHGIGYDNFHEKDEKTGWISDMMQARDEGLVKHVAFSFHDDPESMIKLVDLGLFEMVTCQYNYLDQKNADSIAYAKGKGLGVVAMGPVGGGMLAGMPGFLDGSDSLDLSSAAGLAIRFVLANPDVDIALSGMGNRQMVEDNVEAVERGALNDGEETALRALLGKTRKLAELYCTGCGYCMPCEHGVDIPGRFRAMNFLKAYGMEEHAKRTYKQALNRDAKKGGGGICVECGVCEPKCPQNIAIVEQLRETAAALG